MKNGQLSSFRHKIAETPTYQEFSQVRKKICLRRNVVNLLSHGLTVAKNIGYEKWEQQSGFSRAHKLIVKELLENEV